MLKNEVKELEPRVINDAYYKRIYGIKKVIKDPLGITIKQNTIVIFQK